MNTSLALDILSWILLVSGSFFCVVGGIGLLRLPEFYTRLHASGITDTLGASLILVGLMLQAGLTLVTVKLAFIFFFLFVTSPTAAHALAQAAFTRGLEPMLDRQESESSANSST
ncbi:MAG: monovalent cation/H(+) antiporter subunit G [Acidobacteriota bacterium]